MTKIGTAIIAATISVVAFFAHGMAPSGQETTGISITGTITDPTGAVIANALVHATNEATGITFDATTNAAGTYVIPSVPAGRYQLRAEVQGFKILTREVEVGIGESSRVDLTMDVGTSATMVEVSAPRQAPVYNAVFSPTARGMATHLFAGKRTELRFFIGPHDVNSALDLPQWTVNSKILNQKGNIPLIVTMTCLVCGKDDKNSVQHSVMTFVGKKQVSSEARFKFTPQLPSERSPTSSSQIVLDVSSNVGVNYDRLPINVDVEQVGAAVPQEGTVAVPSFGEFAASGHPTTTPDLILDVTAPDQGVFKVTFIPVHPKLKELFQKLYLTHGNPRSFDTGASVASLQAASDDAALALRTIVNQQDTALQALAAKLVEPTVVFDSRDFVELTDSIYESVLNKLFFVGRNVYQELFEGPGTDPALRQLASQLKSVSSLDNRPPRLLIRAYQISFPWQLLNDSSNKIDQAFWGFRYEITSDSLARGAWSPAISSANEGKVSVFGVYKAAPGELPNVSVNGKRQIDHFKSAVQPDPLLIAQSSESLLDDLKGNRSLNFLLVYGHGSAATSLSQRRDSQGGPDGSVTIEKEAEGRRLILSRDGKIVRPIDLSELQAETELNGEPFFLKQPLVLLNACETGTNSVSLTNELTFPVALLKMGVRGVVATEAPVWDTFALAFGNDLIDEMAAGTQMSAALLHVRVKYRDTHHNPFGLLYSYYGADLGVPVGGAN